MIKKYLILFINKCIRRSKIITRIIFGIKVNNYNHIHWDFTTIALKKYLARYIDRTDSVLEIGTGPFALLSIYIKKHEQALITACDINRDYISNSIKIVNINNT